VAKNGKARNGKAGVARATRRTWKQKPGRA